MAKTVGRGRNLEKARRKRSWTSGGQVPGRKSNARCRNARCRNAPGIVTIVLRGGGCRIKTETPEPRQASTASVGRSVMCCKGCGALAAVTGGQKSRGW
jgi:hypothetical protein